MARSRAPSSSMSKGLIRLVVRAGVETGDASVTRSRAVTMTTGVAWRSDAASAAPQNPSLLAAQIQDQRAEARVDKAGARTGVAYPIDDMALLTQSVPDGLAEHSSSSTNRIRTVHPDPVAAISLPRCLSVP